MRDERVVLSFAWELLLRCVWDALPLGAAHAADTSGWRLFTLPERTFWRERPACGARMASSIFHDFRPRYRLVQRGQKGKGGDDLIWSVAHRRPTNLLSFVDSPTLSLSLPTSPHHTLHSGSYPMAECI